MKYYRSHNDNMKHISNVAVIIVTYNHINYIEECLSSIFKYNDVKVIVVDNNSTDGTPEYIEENFFQVNLIKSADNNGYGAGINLAMENTKMEYVVILNPDTKVERNAIEELLKPLKKHNKIITMPKALIYDGSKINTCGNIEHFTGLAFTRGLGENPNIFNESQIINGLSGVCFAMKRDDFLNLGGFDENFFLYMEDVFFYWMAIINNYKILLVPKSVIYHDYILEVNPKKIYYLERGRYMIIRKYLSVKEYLILLPSFIMTEMLTWGYALLNGFEGVKFKCKALNEGLLIDVKKIDSNKNELLRHLDWKIPEDQLGDTFIFRIIKKFANLIYWANYRIIVNRIFW